MSGVKVNYAKAATGLVARWEHAPELFFREALHVEPWERQIAIANSVDQNSRTAVRSSQKIGKSAACAWVALWWAFTRLGGRVVLTAPAEHQVKNILWPEVRRALLPNPAFPDRPRLIEPDWIALDPRTGLRLPGERGVFCVTTNEPEKLAGLSGKNLLMIVDEGSGYPEELWAPIFGNMAGGGKLLTTGNPTQTSGPFFEAFHEKSDFWNTLHVSSYDTPNVLAGREVIPGLATREWCEERKLEWGEDSADYQVRVLGNFPSQGSNAIVSLAKYEAAAKRWSGDDVSPGVLDIGVDVARFGDDESVIACRFGTIGWIDARLSSFDGTQVAAAVANTIKERRAEGHRVRVKIDEIGYGASVLDRLNELEAKGELGTDVEVYGVNVAKVSDDEETFHALRDQLWFGIASWLETAQFEHDAKVKAELLGAQYFFDARGRRQVEPKEKMKKRIGRSPDGADALALAVYQAREMDFAVGGVRRKPRRLGSGRTLGVGGRAL
jgi:phage terminase large subunit